jgi:hypothetical protein
MTTPTPRRRRSKKLKPRTKAVLTSFVMGLLCGIVLTLTMRPMPAPVAYVQVPEQTTAVVTKAYTGPTPPVITEDTPGFDCRYNGNHICGPGNSNHVKAGLYNRNGKLALTWRELKDWGIWKYGPPANADDNFKAPKH